MAKRPELLITNGDLAGKKYAVKEGGLRLGRSSSNDVHIPDEELSRNHCLFEQADDDGIRLTDLASANGTMLNGKALGNDPVRLKVGDVVEVGGTVIRVVGEDAPLDIDKIDLGLGKPKGDSDGKGKARSPVANVLWGVAAVFVCLGIFLILKTPTTSTEDGAPAEPKDENPELVEAYYEKVEANAEGIFRYEMTLSRTGVLGVTIDDVTKENRHVAKSEPLSEPARAELNEILAFKALRTLDREYVGAEPDEPALESWTLRVVYSSRARSIRIVNTQEPEAFRAIREKLETFSKNQLGIWAIQYSREKLIELAEESIRLGQAKWNDRDVQYGNVHAAVMAFREASFYLETVNPKPDCAGVARRGLEEASAELDRRYRDQRFLADRAINLGQWESALKELRVLVDLVPDRNDERNREASAKLIDVEKRIKGGK